MNNAEKESIIWSSGQYLTLHLPRDYDTWEDEELYSHLVEFAWEPFEYHSGEQIWEYIKELARTKEKTNG